MNLLNMQIIWGISGVVLLILEIFIPGIYISFFGIGALITSLTTLLHLTKSLEMQITVFVISSVLMLAVFHLYIKKLFLKENAVKKNITYINLELGKIVPVIELIEPGEMGGKVKYQGTVWQARSADKIAPGETAKIIGCDNLTLIVEKNT